MTIKPIYCSWASRGCREGEPDVPVDRTTLPVPLRPELRGRILDRRRVAQERSCQQETER